MMMRWKTLTAAAVLSAGLLAGPVLAQELKIGVSTEPSALDPHYHNLGPNNQMAFTIFDTLILQDETQKLTPGLAESWKAINDTTWEFKLRKNVKFHDGSPFTAADVVFSMARPAKVPNSPSPFTLFTRSFSEVKVIDDFTVQFVTKAPAPLLPTDLSRVAIMSSKAAKADVAEGMTTEALSKGEGLIGTGPYKFVEWTRGNRIVLAANPNYWGGKPAWERVIYRPMSNDAARVAALLRRLVALPGLRPWPRRVPAWQYSAGVVLGLSILLGAALKILTGAYSPFIYFRF